MPANKGTSIASLVTQVLKMSASRFWRFLWWFINSVFQRLGAVMLFICWLSRFVVFVMCTCILQGSGQFLVLSMSGGCGWFSISRTWVTSLWQAGTEVVEGRKSSFFNTKHHGKPVKPPQHEWLVAVCTFVLQKRQFSYMLHAYPVNRCCTLRQCWDNVYFVPTSGKNKYVSFCCFACLPSWFATTLCHRAMDAWLLAVQWEAWSWIHGESKLQV